MSNHKTSVAGRNTMLDAVLALLNSGRIEIRTGTQPTNIGDASTGTLLGTPTYGVTAYAGASGASASANSITSDSNADASGDAGYYREYENGAADTAAVFEGDAGEAADTPDLEFDNKTIVAGGTIAISAMTKTQAEQ